MYVVTRKYEHYKWEHEFDVLGVFENARDAYNLMERAARQDQEEQFNDRLKDFSGWTFQYDFRDNLMLKYDYSQLGCGFFEFRVIKNMLSPPDSVKPCKLKMKAMGELKKQSGLHKPEERHTSTKPWNFSPEPCME